MDFLTRILFEDLLWLVVLELVAFAIAVAVYRRRGTAGSRTAVMITVAACVALLVLQSVVETDREKLTQLVKTLVRAADQGDVAAIGELVDDAGVAIGARDAAKCDKPTFLAAANVGLQQYQVDEAGAGGFEIKVNGDTATVSFRVKCDLRESDNARYTTFSQWTIECTRGPQGWRLRRISSAKLGLGNLISSIDIIPYLEGFRRTADSGSRR